MAPWALMLPSPPSFPHTFVLQSLLFVAGVQEGDVELEGVARAALRGLLEACHHRWETKIHKYHISQHLV